MSDDIKEIYKKIKYKLPKFDILDYEFEISTIEPEGFFLRNIVIKIAEKIEFSAKFIEDQLQPESIAAMAESKDLEDDDLEKAFATYKKLMFWLRKANELHFEDDDKTNVEFINNATEEWLSIKKEILELNKKLIKSWTKSSTKKEVLGYLG